MPSPLTSATCRAVTAWAVAAPGAPKPGLVETSSEKLPWKTSPPVVRFTPTTSRRT